MSKRNSLVGRAGLSNRRQILAGVAVSLGGLALAPLIVRAESEEISHAAESIHQEATFKASRKTVYEALTNAAQFDKITHLGAAMQSGMALGTAPTKISPQVGGTFTIFAGHIVGRNIELHCFELPPTGNILR